MVGWWGKQETADLQPACRRRNVRKSMCAGTNVRARGRVLGRRSKEQGRVVEARKLGGRAPRAHKFTPPPLTPFLGGEKGKRGGGETTANA